MTKHQRYNGTARISGVEINGNKRRREEMIPQFLCKIGTGLVAKLWLCFFHVKERTEKWLGQAACPIKDGLGLRFDYGSGMGLNN